MKREQIEKILDNIGIPINIRGYEYLVDAILELDKNPFLSTSDLYKIIAKKTPKDKTAIERSIRYIHEKLNLEIKEYFELNCKINNAILIKAIYRELKRKEEIQ